MGVRTREWWLPECVKKFYELTYPSQWVQRRGPGLGFDTVENAEGVFRSCSLGNECSSLASRRDPPHLNGNEKKKHRRRSVLKRVPRTRQASPAPVQQRRGLYTVHCSLHNILQNTIIHGLMVLGFGSYTTGRDVEVEYST